MKKVLSIAVLAMVLVLAMVGNVNAATKSELINQIYSIGSKYGMTAADRVRLERYVSDYNVTEEKLAGLVTKANEVAAVMDEQGVTNYEKLTEAGKEKVKSIATVAAASVDATVVFKTKSVEVYRNGKLIEKATENNGKLAYTGNELNVVLAIVPVVSIALVATLVVKRRLAIAR